MNAFGGQQRAFACQMFAQPGNSAHRRASKAHLGPGKGASLNEGGNV
jgi:hypothetical protein